MKKKFISIIIAACCFIGCTKDEAKPSAFESKILGNWRIVDANNQPSNAEWGLFYVFTTKLYADKSFKINLGEGVDSSAYRTGTWILNEKLTSITFYSAVDDFGTMYRDTTEFNISIDASDRLILENTRISIKHIKLTN